MEDGSERTKFPTDILSEIGMLEPEAKRRLSLSSSIRFQVEDDLIFTVEVPHDVRLNIIKKPFARVDSPLGQAILLSEATKSADNSDK